MLKKLTFEGRFECGFDKIGHGKVRALTPTIQPGGIGLGIAVANERGYYPVPLHWCRADTYDEMDAHADELNKELFNLLPRAAAVIVASSMRAQNEEKWHSPTQAYVE